MLNMLMESRECLWFEKWQMHLNHLMGTNSESKNASFMQPIDRVFFSIFYRFALRWKCQKHFIRSYLDCKTSNTLALSPASCEPSINLTLNAKTITTKQSNWHNGIDGLWNDEDTELLQFIAFDCVIQCQNHAYTSASHQVDRESVSSRYTLGLCYWKSHQTQMNGYGNLLICL